MGSDVGLIFLTAILHRDHSVLYAMVCEKELSHMDKNIGNPNQVCKKNRIHHWCSVGTGISHPKGPPFQWQMRLAKFTSERWTQGLGFPVNIEQQLQK